MGMFVEYDVDGRRGQLKVWNDCNEVRYLETYLKGEKVPAISRAGYPLESETYSIRLGSFDLTADDNEGFLNVENQIITGWSYYPEYQLIMSAYGDMLSETGI